MRRIAGVLLVAGLSMLASGCKQTINEVLADPQRWANEDVEVGGEVVDSYSVLGRGAYQINDGTGQLWVVSTSGVPRTGARVVVKGRVRDGFDLGSLGGDLLQRIGQGVILMESSHQAE